MSGFMQPQYNEGTYVPTEEGFVEEEFFTEEDHGARDGDNKTGFFWRLSAPGYMDCTSWSGPFKTEKAAIADCGETHEDICPNEGCGTSYEYDDKGDVMDTCASCFGIEGDFKALAEGRA